MYNLDKITRRVKVMIGGREYALAFSLSSLQELEKYLGNINTLFTRGEIPTLNELVTAFWIALKGGGQNIEKKDAESLIASFCREYGLEKLTEIFFVTFAMSGFLGKKASDKLLKQFVKDEDVKELSENNSSKNGKAAKHRK